MSTSKSKLVQGKVVQKYRDLISMTQEEIDIDSQNVDVELAENNLQQGIQSITGQLIKQKGLVLAAKSEVTIAERELTTAKSRRPFSTQSILDSLRIVKQKQNNLTVEEAVQAQYEETLKTLTDLKLELF